MTFLSRIPEREKSLREKKQKILYGSILPSRSYNKIKDILLKDLQGPFLLYDALLEQEKRQNKTNQKLPRGPGGRQFCLQNDDFHCTDATDGYWVIKFVCRNSPLIKAQ